jgi:Tfp pilus assembly protein FimV
MFVLSMSTALVLSVSLTRPAQAAETSASAAAALKVLALPTGDGSSATGSAPTSPGAPSSMVGGMAPQGQSITVQKGESIDAVIRRGLPGLPLKDDFMRLALAKANPKIFPRGQTYPVRPGTVLMLPSHEALRQLIVSRHPQAADLFQATPAPSAEPDAQPQLEKRRWVRFP